MSKRQVLSIAFVCYLGFTVTLFGLPTTDIQTGVIDVWNTIIKSVDPKRLIDEDTSQDFATF